VDLVTELMVLGRVPGVGPGRIKSLLTSLRTPAAIRRAGPGSLAAVPGIGPRVAGEIHRFYRGRSLRDEEERALAMRARMEAGRVGVVHLWDPGYPQLLSRIFDPPPLLYWTGTLLPRDAGAVAIVGTRRPTPHGLELAGYFGRELAAGGVTVVSGLARGIDTAAHAGALRAGGRSLAVVGTGVDQCYPRENRRLAADLVSFGAVVSEFEPGTPPEPGNFPRRNRIISGLSLGTIVIESDTNGGAMITASFALEQNREVFAVPGRVGSPKSRGCHALIRDGRAKLVETAEDVVTEIRVHLPPGVGLPVTAGGARATLNPREEKVYARLGPEPAHADELAASTGVPAGQLVADLLALELKGLVRQLPGKYFIRTL